VPSVTNSQHFLFDHLASAGAISLPEASASAGSSGCRRFGHRSQRAIGPDSTCSWLRLEVVGESARHGHSRKPAVVY